MEIGLASQDPGAGLSVAAGWVRWEIEVEGFGLDGRSSGEVRTRPKVSIE